MLIPTKLLRVLVVTLTAMLPAPLFAQAPSTGSGQAYPVKPIRMILPFPPGGPTDITGRTIAQKLSEQLGQPVVPENRPGAAGNLGLELGAKAPPDGYTITLAAPPLAVSPSLYAKLNYDAVRDFAPVSLVAAIHNIMVVHNSVPAKSLKEFIQLARRYPGKLNFSSSGAGSTNHLASELLKGRYQLDMVHVPYKGAALALVALMSGQVDMGIMAVPPAIPQVQANKVRALCVLTERREPQLPNVPTSKEAGVDDFVMPIWYGILAPAGTPREIVNRLNSEIHKALASADLKQRFASAGVEPLPSTPEHFSGFIKSEMARYSKVIKDAGIKIE
ncbi:MAG: Bug family tripartite tricarboxylate transporter substrate binding protein [Burkholderiales bacterium]